MGSLLAADRIRSASSASTLKEIRLAFLFIALSHLKPILVEMGGKTDSAWGPKILLPESWNCRPGDWLNVCFRRMEGT
jgi:hypothetical protein